MSNKKMIHDTNKSDSFSVKEIGKLKPSNIGKDDKKSTETKKSGNK